MQTAKKYVTGNKIKANSHLVREQERFKPAQIKTNKGICKQQQIVTRNKIKANKSRYKAEAFWACDSIPVCK